MVTASAGLGTTVRRRVGETKQGSKKKSRKHHVVEEAEAASDAYSSDEDWMAEQANPAHKTPVQVQRVVYKVTGASSSRCAARPD